jgi:hypothetical protein
VTLPSIDAQVPSPEKAKELQEAEWRLSCLAWCKQVSDEDVLEAFRAVQAARGLL